MHIALHNSVSMSEGRDIRISQTGERPIDLTLGTLIEN